MNLHVTLMVLVAVHVLMPDQDTVLALTATPLRAASIAIALEVSVTVPHPAIVAITTTP